MKSQPLQHVVFVQKQFTWQTLARKAEKWKAKRWKRTIERDGTRECTSVPKSLRTCWRGLCTGGWHCAKRPWENFMDEFHTAIVFTQLFISRLHLVRLMTFMFNSTIDRENSRALFKVAEPFSLLTYFHDINSTFKFLSF